MWHTVAGPWKSLWLFADEQPSSHKTLLVPVHSLRRRRGVAMVLHSDGAGNLVLHSNGADNLPALLLGRDAKRRVAAHRRATDRPSIQTGAAENSGFCRS